MTSLSSRLGWSTNPLCRHHVSKSRRESAASASFDFDFDVDLSAAASFFGFDFDFASAPALLPRFTGAAEASLGRLRDFGGMEYADTKTCGAAIELGRTRVPTKLPRDIDWKEADFICRRFFFSAKEILTDSCRVGSTCGVFAPFRLCLARSRREQLQWHCVSRARSARSAHAWRANRDRTRRFVGSRGFPPPPPKPKRARLCPIEVPHHRGTHDPRFFETRPSRNSR